MLITVAGLPALTVTVTTTVISNKGAAAIIGFLTVSTGPPATTMMEASTLHHNVTSMQLNIDVARNYEDNIVNNQS
ncbi:uncharacterized protein LOC124362064 isoform X4 [Homalodisca vitripennis]|uniref:uncharacterized protein LOC124362064 isoform X4 n=1 Tax=Homalodisca vitripennis TaxID=197043 RepID=UPI001EEB00F6|nr:uncharacterized protein LOC124362064 isoform X4 [Homalodisca vitripennis]